MKAIGQFRALLGCQLLKNEALKRENARLLKSLKCIQTMCGNPDPAEACRVILKEATEAARRGNGLAQT